MRRVRRDVQGADRDLEEVRDDADQTLRQHPRLAAVVGLASGVLREQSAEQVGLAASGAAFWVVISALPTVVAVVSLFGLAISPARVTADLGTLARDAPSSLGGLLTEQLRQVTVGALHVTTNAAHIPLRTFARLAPRPHPQTLRRPVHPTVAV